MTQRPGAQTSFCATTMLQMCGVCSRSAYSSQRKPYVAQYCLGCAFSHVDWRHAHLAAQQKLGLLSQQRFGFGVVDPGLVDVGWPHLNMPRCWQLAQEHDREQCKNLFT